MVSGHGDISPYSKGGARSLTDRRRKRIFCTSAILDIKPQDGNFSSFYDFPSFGPSTNVSGSSGRPRTTNPTVETS